MIKIMHFLLILPISVLLFASSALGGHFEGSITSPTLMHLAGSLKIGGEVAIAGDEIGIFDKSGKILGVFVVKKKGIYGDVAITGDDYLTDEQEGAMEGETLEISVWQKSTNREYSGGDLYISSPAEGESIYTSYPRELLQFEAGTFYFLNIEVY